MIMRYLDWLMDMEPGWLGVLLFLSSIFGFLLLCLSPFIIYDITVVEPRWNAWVHACETKGGRPMPTRVWYDKHGAHYGDYICAKVDTIDPGVEQ
jgi:hypothetical protein